MSNDVLLPAPFVAPEVDLKDFPFTPLYRARLFGSSFHAQASDAEWRAGVTLWLKSWDQVPAGSLPTDDIELCRLAELGRDMRTWAKVKARAMHGWTRCADGRFYHRVVADGVVDAWDRKQSYAARTTAARAAKLAKRQSQSGPAAIIDPVSTSITEPVTEPVTDTVTRLKGQGQGQGQGQESPDGDSLPPSEAKASPGGKRARGAHRWPATTPDHIPEAERGGTGKGIYPDGPAVPYAWVSEEAERRWPEIDRDLRVDRAQEEAVRFEAYWTVGKGGRVKHADWRATWRNWMDKARGPRLEHFGFDEGVHRVQ